VKNLCRKNIRWSDGLGELGFGEMGLGELGRHPPFSHNTAGDAI